MRSAPFLLLALAFLLILPTLTSGSPATEANQKVFITSSHVPILAEFFSETYTNTTDPWTSPMRPFRNFTVHLIGVNLSWNIELMGQNLSFNGTTNATYTKVAIPATGLVLWPIVTFNNQTYNFGQMVISAAPITLAERPEAETVLKTEADKAIFDMLVATVVATAALNLAVYLTVVRIKRGRIIVW